MARRIVVFTAAYVVLIMLPAFLKQPFGLYPLITTGEALDVLTPLVLIPLYWMLFALDKTPSLNETIVFLVLAAFWVEGQGMHLSANAVQTAVTPVTEARIHDISYFYDEVLSHYLWHIGVCGLSALVIWRQSRNPLLGLFAKLWVEIIAGLVYGLIYFITFNEAGTAPLGIPFAIIIVVIGLIGRKKLRQQPITTFFVAAHALALLLFAIWFLKWGYLPQFSELGWI